MARDIIVITGPGRSGTSLCAAILVECGARISDALVPGSNYPRGLCEDREVVAIDKKLLDRFFYQNLLPRPSVRNKPFDMRSEVDDLSRIIRKNIRQKQVWVVKDPRISLLLEPWRRATRNTKTHAHYVFCYRDPRDVIAAMHKHHKWDPLYTEHVWLIRTAWFFAHMEEPAAIVGFERWFRRPQKTLLDLLQQLPLKPKREAKLEAYDVIDQKRRPDAKNPGVKLPETRALHKALANAGPSAGPHSEVAKISKSIVADLQKWPPVATELYRLADAIK